MKINRIKALLGFTTLFLLVATFFSCNKETPTKVVVTVIDTSTFPVSQVEVRLYGKQTKIDTATGEVTEEPVRDGFDQVKTTDENGQAMFDYSSYTKPGQAGFAVLDIEASYGNLQGISSVNIEENKTNYKKVIIQ